MQLSSRKLQEASKLLHSRPNPALDFDGSFHLSKVDITGSTTPVLQKCLMHLLLTIYWGWFGVPKPVVMFWVMSSRRNKE